MTLLVARTTHRLKTRSHWIMTRYCCCYRHYGLCWTDSPHTKCKCLFINHGICSGLSNSVEQKFYWCMNTCLHILKENAEALVAATREIRLEVSADKTKYMVMSRDQNAGWIHSVRIDNRTFERVEEFKYLGTTLTNQNSIAEEIKSRLKSENACYHLVQNLLSSRLLSKNLKI